MAMKGYKTAALMVVILCSLLAFWHIFSLRMAEGIFIHRLAGAMTILAEGAPELEAAALAAISEPDKEKVEAGFEILTRYGYEENESVFLQGRDYLPGLGLSLAAALCLAAMVFYGYRRRQCQRQARSQSLSSYLAEINAGEYRLRPSATEDDLSPLEDELYKTVVLLREGREQAAAAREALVDNLADIAHQLKTPLSSITLIADMLSLSPQADTAAQGIQLSGQADRMTRLVSSLLALSRIEAGTLTLEHKLVDTGELLLCARDAVVVLLEQRSQTLSLALHDASYSGDFEWSIQAIANILKNCSEHTPPGGTIAVSCQENPIYTTIVIEDSGPGIEAADLPHLFERFYRGSDTQKDSAGIGLALAKALVEAQNGQLTAENRKSGGARFIIKFYHLDASHLDVT